jgi:predicted nucleic-acid-binding Zn-ribbon protein
MKASGTCPKCESSDILHYDQVDDLGMLNSVEPMALNHTKWTGKPVGRLEAYVCRGCGFTEFYCADAGEQHPPPE